MPPTRPALTRGGSWGRFPISAPATSSAQQPNTPVTTLWEAQRQSGVVALVMRPDEEKMLDIAYVNTFSDEDRRGLQRLLEGLVPNLTIYPWTQSPYRLLREIRGRCEHYGRCVDAEDIISVPFDSVKKAPDVINFTFGALGRTVHWVKWERDYEQKA
ncbi:hypothetical protein O9K51_01264 [Purpureocillium lavendulum]|uniref:Uncharacterized protein n=1 Tax=Purpureocillium lavendulum TaxID=1247861 RepID=A0AB34G6E0_9HYPO|nr:hypothetical protein O9K51_01264 [Purpureocillium lavendulum]